MDLSSSVNRIRFDGLASVVYRQVGAKLTEIVKEAGYDLTQIDEVLLAGASALFPGLQQQLALLVPPTTPVTATIDPSQVIAIGCALQALHLSTLEDGLKVDDVLSSSQSSVDSTSKPIGVVIPGSEGKSMIRIIDSGAPLPVRRRVAIPVGKGVSSVAVEIWEGREEVKVEKVERSERANGEDDEDSEDDEPEETRTPIMVKEKALGGLGSKVDGRKEVILEVIVHLGGALEARLWQEGKEAEADKLEA